MPTSPRLLIPYPDQNSNPWDTVFNAMVLAIDASLYTTREDRNIIISGGGTLTFNASTGVLTWSAPISLLAAVTGYQWTIPIGEATLLDGQILYITVARAPQSNTTYTPVIGSLTPNQPNGDNQILVGVRIGSVVHFRDGFLIGDGQSILVFDNVSSGGGGPSVNIEHDGTPIANNPHTTVNFTGSSISSVVDSGGGVATVTVSGGGAVVFTDVAKTSIASARLTNQLGTDATAAGLTNLGSDSTDALAPATGDYATIGGGDQNLTMADKADVSGGVGNMAAGLASHTEGEGNASTGEGSHAEGSSNFATGDTSHVEGRESTAGYPPDSFTILAGGTLVTISGNVTQHFRGEDNVWILPNTPSMKKATASNFLEDNPAFDGVNTTFHLHTPIDGTTTAGLIADPNIAFCAHAEGFNSQALNESAHAEGHGTIAYGSDSHSEGNGTQAIGNRSHAEGDSGQAIGVFSHTEGLLGQPWGSSSHTEGRNNIVCGDFGHAEGINCVTGFGPYSFTCIAGDTDLVIPGDQRTGLFSDGGDILILAQTPLTIEYGFSNLNPSFDGTNTHLTLPRPMDTFTTAGELVNTDNGAAAHAEGGSCIAQGPSSHAEGQSCQAIGASSHAEGFGSFAGGNYSHAEGNAASPGGASHAEGGSSSPGNNAHAEGTSNASGPNSHSEGLGFAFGSKSHAEGTSVGFSASGSASSHVEGSACQAGNPIRAFTVVAGGVTLTIAGDVTSEFVNGHQVILWDQSPSDAATSFHSLASNPVFASGNTTFDIDSPINSYSTFGLIVDDSFFQAAHAEGITSIAQGTGSHAQGVGANTTMTGQDAMACGPDFATAANVKQTGTMVLRGTTPGSVAAETVELKFGENDPPTETIPLINGKSYIVDIDMIARTATGGTFAFGMYQKFVARRDGGTVTVLGMGSQTTGGAAAGDATAFGATAFTVGGGGHLVVTFAVGAGKTLACSVAAAVRITETA